MLLYLDIEGVIEKRERATSIDMAIVERAINIYRDNKIRTVKAD